MIKRMVFICSLFTMLASGCKKDNGPTQASQDQFPNQAGDQWHYLVKDTTIHAGQDSIFAQYNVDVVIVDSVKWSNGITASIWQFNYPDHMDTSYVYPSGDTLKVLDRQLNLVGQYIFPFTSGASWPYIPGVANVTVTGPAALSAGGLNYPEAWHLSGAGGLPDAPVSVDEWFVANTGFVRKYFNSDGDFILIRHNTEWVLVSYKLQ